jgi:predicted secreted protein
MKRVDSSNRLVRLRQALPDARGGRVVFVSHCLLNQNTRYLGGAACPGAVRSAIEGYLDGGVGIVQMPCPEQRTWGGVLKRRFLWLLDHPRLAKAPRTVAAATRLYLRIRYRRLARAVTRDIADYIDSGLEVTGVVGVAGSPSCGAGTTLDLEAAVRTLGSCPRRSPTAEWLNEDVIGAASRPGSGLFLEALAAELTRRHLTVSTTEVVARPRATGSELGSGPQ